MPAEKEIIGIKTMPTKKKLTGYPSIDKPWLKYYANKKTIDFDACQTIYNNFRKVAKKQEQDTAIVNYRTSQIVTFSGLLLQADEFACALSVLGINKYSKVVVLTFNSIVDPIALLGSNKIGAVIEYLDPDSDIAQMRQHTSNADVLIVEGVFLPLAKQICNRIPIIVYNSLESLSDKHCIAYSEFIENGREAHSVSINTDADVPSVIIFSSGSTGAPKPIVHSNLTVNSAVRKMMCSDFPLNNDNFMVKTIPSFIGLGAITTMLVALMSGMPHILLGTIDESVYDYETSDSNLIAKFTVPESLDLIRNYKTWLNRNALESNKGLVFFAAPIFFKFIHYQAQSITDMSFVKGILLGGSKMSKEELEAMELIFKIKELSVPIGIGYGQNELCGAVALNTVHHNKNGSAGYPVLDTEIRIVDRDTYEDVKYNQIGLILERSDSAFLYYDNMPEETSKAKIILPDETEWYNTNDLGYMDEDGFLFITGRTNRVVIKSDHKVSMDVVESKIKAIDGVKDAAVVPYNNGKEDGDTVVFLTLKNEAVKMTLEIINDHKNGLTTFETPVRLVIVRELPRMNNSKVDYRALKDKADKL